MSRVRKPLQAVRHTVTVAALAVAMLGGCTSGSPGHSKAPSTSHTPTAIATSGHLTAQCRRLVDVASRVSKAETALYSSGAAGSIGALQSALRSLAHDVPPNVAAALTELAAGFGTAHQLLADPTDQNKTALTKLAPKLATDARTVSSYIVTTCPA
jgi:hypothetical protein